MTCTHYLWGEPSSNKNICIQLHLKILMHTIFTKQCNS
uniref:Uncharacterized protein n=1 Tax=Anguilla anguilla TaxID=7936 RepID=A0A0E9SIE5_ANGAN